MPFLSPNQQCQSTEGKNITSHGLAYPKLTWGLAALATANCLAMRQLLFDKLTQTEQ